MHNPTIDVACVASISVGFRSKERPRNGILPAQNWGESQNKKEGVGERKEGMLPDKPLDFENLSSVCQRTGLVIGWTSQALLTCVDHRLREEGEACLEKFLGKRVFSHELRQYGGNPVVRCLGISKHVCYCKRKCGTIFVIFLLRCLKRLLPKFQRLSVVCLVTGDNTHTKFFPLVCLANASLLELAL